MVKGLSRRVVVVKSPDKRFFEEAIFILREDTQTGVSAQDVISQAQHIVESYVSANSKILTIVRGAVYALCSLAIGVLGYFLAGLIF